MVFDLSASQAMFATSQTSSAIASASLPEWKQLRFDWNSSLNFETRTWSWEGNQLKRNWERFGQTFGNSWTHSSVLPLCTVHCACHHHNTFCSKQKLDWVQHQKWVSGYQERTNSPQGFIFSSGPASVSLFNQSHTDCLPGLPAFTGNNWRFPQLNWFRLIAIDKVHFDFQKSWCEAGGRVRLYPTLSVIVIGH